MRKQMHVLSASILVPLFLLIGGYMLLGQSAREAFAQPIQDKKTIEPNSNGEIYNNVLRAPAAPLSTGPAYLVKDIYPAGRERNFDPDEMTVSGDTLFFAAHDDSNSEELWISDGTPEHVRNDEAVIAAYLGVEDDEVAEAEAEVLK